MYLICLGAYYCSITTIGEARMAIRPILSLLTLYVRDIYSLVPQHSDVYILSTRPNLLLAIIALALASIISYAYELMRLNSIDIARSLS